MHPIIQQLIDKHLGASPTLPHNYVAFLQELSKVLEEKETEHYLTSTPQSNRNDIQTLMDSMPFGITIISKEKTILAINNTALEMMGYESQDELKGSICHDSLCPAAEGECPIINLKQKMDRSERILITKNNKRIPILKSVTPIMLDENEVLLEAFIDISEREELAQEREKAHERRAWLAENVSAIIKEMATKEQTKDLYQLLVDQLAAQFEFPRAQFFIYNPVANNLRLMAAAGRDGIVPKTQAAVIPVGSGNIGKAAETIATTLHTGSRISHTDYPELISNSIQSEITFPIAIDQEMIGVLNIQSDHPDQFDRDIILFMETLTTQAALIIQTIKFKNEMRDQLEELSVLQRMTSTEGWKTFESTSTLSASSYVFDQNLQTTIPVKNQKDFSKDSSIIKPLEIRGQTIGALGVSTENEQQLTNEEKLLLDSISSEVAEALERARLFETSQRSAAELAVLNEMGNSFSQAETEEVITQNIYTYTSQLMEAPQFYVAYYHPEDEIITFPYVVMEDVHVTPEHPHYEQWLPKPLGSGLTGHIIKTQQPILLNENAEKKLAELELPFLQFGGQTLSWLGVPMLLGNNVLGVIAVQSEETTSLYNQHHLNLLTTIASQAAVAINNTRQYQQEQERAEQERLVRTITDKVRRGTDTATIMRTALEELSTILDADISTIQLGTKDQLTTNQAQNTDNQAASNGKHS